MKDFKLSLVLTGHMRCWQQTYINTYQRIIQPLKPSVYITTWSDEGYWISPEADKTNLGINPQSPKLNWDAVQETYGIYYNSRIHVESFSFQKARLDELAKIFLPYCQEIRPVNTLSQFWIMNKGMSNFWQDSIYNSSSNRAEDLVVRMRPDLILGEEITEVIRNADPTKFYTLYHRNHTGLGTGDMFFMSARKNVEYLTQSMSNVAQLTRLTLKYNRFCPHIFVKDLIDEYFDHVELNIPKTLHHTPNGQYRDWKPE